MPLQMFERLASLGFVQYLFLKLSWLFRHTLEILPSHYKINLTPFNGKNLFDLWKRAVKNINSWHAISDNTQVDRFICMRSVAINWDNYLKMFSQNSNQFSMASPHFPGFPGLDFTMLKFHDFPGFPWPTRNLFFWVRLFRYTTCLTHHATVLSWRKNPLPSREERPLFDAIQLRILYLHLFLRRSHFLVMLWCFPVHMFPGL